MARSRINKKSTMEILIKYIAIIAISAIGYQSVKLIRVSQTLDEQIEKTQKEIYVEEQKLERLKKEYENIDSLENVEKMARDKLGFVKEDEIVFRIQK